VTYTRPVTATEETIREATAHRVQGLLWRAIDTGVVSADETVRAAAAEAASAALRTCLLAESVAVQAAEAITKAGADVRVLKGVAIAHLDHDDPAERVFGDCDLLVRRSHLPAALRGLTATGFTRAEPPVRGWWERRYGKAIVLYPPTGDGELDLHLAITGGWFGARIDHDEIWRHEPTPMSFGGVALHALHLDDRLLQACCHTMLGGSSGLRAKRDVAQLILSSGADWIALADRLERVDAHLVLSRAISTVWNELFLDQAHDAYTWAAWQDGSEAQRAALASYEAAFAEGWGPEGKAAIDSMRLHDRVMYATGLLLPSRASLRHRNRTLPQHLRRMVGSLRGSNG
jgi:hypothetical protein